CPRSAVRALGALQSEGRSDQLHARFCARCFPPHAAGSRPVINVYCEARGWLFDDLRREIAKHGAVASTHPRPDADAWICIRSREFGKTPDPTRTVLQVHDLKTKPRAAGHVSFVHPD